MLMVTPCTDWYLVFTGSAKGNTALSASILPLNLILQIILLPVFLLIFSGKAVSIIPGELIESILLVLLLPFACAQLLKFVLRKKFKSSVGQQIILFFENSQVILLGLAIVAMFASQGAVLTNNLEIVLVLLLPLLLFFIINFFISRLVSYLLKLNYSDAASLNMTTLARNSPVALAIAVTAFPDTPIIALALVIGPLIELPVLATVTQVLLKIKKETSII